MLREKTYFDQRADNDMKKHLKRLPLEVREALARACRIIAMEGHEAGLAGQVTVRADGAGFWTLRFGLGFDEAQPSDFIRVDDDLNTVEGDGMANPATRFHLWVYRARLDVNCIIHSHPPHVSALAATGQPLQVSQMDMTPFYEDCAFLKEWPGVPIADQEGEIISKHLGNCRSILLAHHGLLVAGGSVEEAAYLAVYMERAARMQIRASAVGPLLSLDPALAREAHDYLLKPGIVNATFDYLTRQARRHFPDFRA